MHRRGMTLIELLIVAILIVLAIWIMGRVDRRLKAAHYRRSAEQNGRFLNRCREIIALSPAERQRQIAQGADDPLNFLSNPDRARRFIPYFAQRRDNDLWQAEHPDDPTPPVLPEPDR